MKQCFITVIVANLFVLSLSLPAFAQSSPEIYQVQKALQNLGYNPGSLDGYGGKATENAVKQFQRDYDMPATGLVDAQTKSKLGVVPNQNDSNGSPTVTNSTGMNFAYIRPGSFMMGSPVNESGRYDDEKQHRVTLTKGFYIQVTEVTQGQWKAIMGNNPSYFSDCGDNCPVEKVSWNDAQTFISKLNRKEGGSRYRLPTEAEWEYAARAGSTTRFCFGKNKYGLPEYAWYDSRSGRKTHPVAQKQSNAWGLYDMHGNVWEWCQDWSGDYPSDSVTDPTGPSSGSLRVSRGGSWHHRRRHCRSASRGGSRPAYRGNILGFRLALSSG